MSTKFDVIVVGAGAAGMMCAAVTGQRGARVALVDHALKIGEKIRISGGGRCNFTNVGTSFANMVGNNPRFSRFALTEYDAGEFISLVRGAGIAFHEKHKGQMFCDRSSQDIIDLLIAECAKGGVTWFNPVEVYQIQRAADSSGLFTLVSNQATLTAANLVIATGGLSIPKIGASDFGFQLARQFGIRVTETRPSLVPLTFDAQAWQAWVPMAGVSLPVSISTNGSILFEEDLLITHRGLSGPAILQISNYWNPQLPIKVNLLPQVDLSESLIAKKSSSVKTLGNELHGLLPRQLLEHWLSHIGFNDLSARKIPEVPDKAIRKLHESLTQWSLVPDGTEGYKKAEVTRGGVSTDELDQKTFAAKKVPGLHFIGEVVDITGWLGGYNFQWAWSSAVACARGLTPT